LPPIDKYDEPTDAVELENIPLPLDYITKSMNKIKQVILVTHHRYGMEEKVKPYMSEEGRGRIQSLLKRGIFKEMSDQ